MTWPFSSRRTRCASTPNGRSPDEAPAQYYPRTPSFAWDPVSARGGSYEFELATSRSFNDSSILFSYKDLTIPAVAVDHQLPWMTGVPYALWAHVRWVSSNGKKVTPSYLEGLLLADGCIDQAVIYGEGRNFLTALVVPNWEQTRKALAAEGVTLPAEDEDKLARNPAVQALLVVSSSSAVMSTGAFELVASWAAAGLASRAAASAALRERLVRRITSPAHFPSRRVCTPPLKIIRSPLPYTA